MQGNIIKNSVRHFSFECSKRRTDSLLQAKYKNAKSYWKLLKDSVSNNQPTDITFNTFTKYSLSQLTIQMIASSSLTKILNILIKDF